MSLEKNNLLIAKFSDEVIRTMADSYFTLLGKVRPNLGGGKYLSRYQSFMDAARESVNEFATYLYQNGYSLDNYNLMIIVSSLTNTFFSSLLNSEEYERYANATEFITKYIDVYYRAFVTGDQFASNLYAKGIDMYETATRTSMDIAKNYYASMEDDRKQKLSKDLDGTKFVSDSYDYLEMVYPEVIEYDVARSQLAIETTGIVPRS